MLKTIFLAGAMMVTVPAIAQDMPQETSPAPTTATTQDNTVPSQQVPATQGAPITGTPVTEQAATAATPTDPAATTAPAETAATTPATDAATPASGSTQIAQVVSTEFPTYDKNADKALDKSEFGQWMVALKSASDPSTKPTDPATKKWVDGAFASADTDKSKSVSQTELTSYLSQGAG